MAEGPRFEASSRSLAEVDADLVVIPVFEGGGLGAGGAELSRAIGTDPAAIPCMTRVRHGRASAAVRLVSAQVS